MSSLQVLTRSIDRRLVTPKRLGEIVDLGDGGSTSSVSSLIGATAVTANPTEARRYIDMATEKVEKMLDGLIFYRQSADGIEVVRVLHESMDVHRYLGPQP